MISTVLLVDDDSNLLDGLRRSLRKPDLELLCADGAETAFDLLHQRRVDVVVTDDGMPGISGLDFLAQIRHLFPAIMRIMLTGNASVERMSQAINEELVFRFLAKPSPAAALGEAIRQAIRQKRLMDQGREALHIIRRQMAVIEHLQQTHPQVLSAALDAVAGLKVAPDDFVDAGRLAEEMEVQIRTFSGLHPALNFAKRK